VLAGLVGFIFLGSGINKLIGGAEVIAMAEGFGLSASDFTILAIIEIISAILFIYPRTGILGTLLLAAYMGGAIATHLEHGQPFVVQAVIQAFLWIVAVVRFPELTQRFLSNK